MNNIGTIALVLLLIVVGVSIGAALYWAIEIYKAHKREKMRLKWLKKGKYKSWPQDIIE